MIEEQTTRGFDFAALRVAIEGGDPDLLLGFYTEDAELRIVNAALPDGPAFELKGRAEIERYLRTICNQQMTCLVEDEVVFGEGRITFGEVCGYPDGTRVVVQTTLELSSEGEIVGQLDVVTQDQDAREAEAGEEGGARGNREKEEEAV